jgi:hypothetical protein
LIRGLSFHVFFHLILGDIHAEFASTGSNEIS